MCSMRSWSASRTSAGANGSPPWWRYGKVRPPHPKNCSRTAATTSPATRFRRACTSSTRCHANRAESPTTRALRRSPPAKRPDPPPERSVEDVGGDQLFEVAVVPPADLELLGPAEIELDVVLDGEADAAEDLLGHGRDIS